MFVSAAADSVCVYPCLCTASISSAFHSKNSSKIFPTLEASNNLPRDALQVPALQPALIASSLVPDVVMGMLPGPPALPQEFPRYKGMLSALNKPLPCRHKGFSILTKTLRQTQWGVLGSTDQVPLWQVFDPYDLYTGEQFSKVLSTLTALNKATEGKKQGGFSVAFPIPLLQMLARGVFVR